MNEIPIEREFIEAINKERIKRAKFAFFPDFLVLFKATESISSQDLDLSNCLLENNYFESFELEIPSSINYSQDLSQERLEYQSIIDYNLGNDSSQLFSENFNSLALKFKKGMNSKKIVFYLIQRKALINEIKSEGDSIRVTGFADMSKGNVVGVRIRGGGTTHPTLITTGSIFLNEISKEFSFSVRQKDFVNFKNYSEYSIEILYSENWRGFQYGNFGCNAQDISDSYAVNRGPFIPFRPGNIIQVYFRVLNAIKNPKAKREKMKEIIPNQINKNNTDFLFSRNDQPSLFQNKNVQISNNSSLFNSHNNENLPPVPSLFKSHTLKEVDSRMPIQNQPLFQRPRQSFTRSYTSPLEPIKEEFPYSPIPTRRNMNDNSFPRNTNTPIFKNRNPLAEIEISPINSQMYENKENSFSFQKLQKPEVMLSDKNIFKRPDNFISPINQHRISSNEMQLEEIPMQNANKRMLDFSEFQFRPHTMIMPYCQNYNQNYQISPNYVVQPYINGQVEKNEDKNNWVIQNATKFNLEYKKTETISNGVKLEILPNLVIEKNESNFSIIDPIVFLDPNSESSVSILKNFALQMEYSRKNSQFSCMFGETRMADVLLILENKEFKAHRTVIASSSPYFSELLSNSSNTYGIERLRIPNTFSPTVFEILIKFMYFGTFELVDLEKFSMKEIRELFAASNYYRVSDAMKQLALEYLIPKMDQVICACVLSEIESARLIEDKGCSLVWEILYGCSISYFSHFSKKILSNKELKSSLTKIDKELLINISNAALQKVKDKDNLVEIIKLLIDANISADILGLIDYVSGPFKDFRSFDKLEIDGEEIIQEDIRPDKAYIIELNEETNKHLKISNNLRFRGEFIDPSHTSFHNIDDSKKPSLNWKFCIKEGEENEKEKRILLISEKFHSETRFWRIHLIINEKKVSFFLKEDGEIKDRVSLFKPILASILMKIQIDDEFCKKENFLFHSFNCGQKEKIGIADYLSISELANKDVLHLKFTISEFPIHSSAIFYCISQFQILICLDKGVEKRLSATGIEKEMKKSFFKFLNDQISSPLKQKKEELSAKFNYSFENISPFDLYSILNSDNLDVEHESVVLFFIYNFILSNSEEFLTLLLTTVRYPFLTMKNLLDVSRDHPAFRRNSFFQKKMKEEVIRRINCSESLDNGSKEIHNPRIFYNKEKYKMANSSSEFFSWLFESEHHEDLKANISELKEEMRLQKEFYEKELKEKELKFMALKGDRNNERKRRIPDIFAYEEPDREFQWSCNIY